MTRDAFSEYLAARWIVEDSTSFRGVASRLMIMIGSGDFIAGGRFVAHLQAQHYRNGDREIAAYLRGVLDDPAESPSPAPVTQ